MRVAGLCALLAFGSVAYAEDSLKSAIDRGFSSITNYIDITSFSPRTNVDDNAALLVSFDTEKFDKAMKNASDIPKEYSTNIMSVYIGRATIDLETQMQYLKQNPTIGLSLTYDGLKSDIENAKKWSAIAGVKPKILPELEKAVAMVPYERQMLIAEDYMAKNVYVVGVLRAYCDAGEELLKVPITYDDYKAYVERSNKGVKFINEWHAKSEEGVKKTIKEEGARFKELRTKVFEHYKAKK
jgi:hypothetical protein